MLRGRSGGLEKPLRQPGSQAVADELGAPTAQQRMGFGPGRRSIRQQLGQVRPVADECRIDLPVFRPARLTPILQGIFSLEKRP